MNIKKTNPYGLEFIKYLKTSVEDQKNYPDSKFPWEFIKGTQNSKIIKITSEIEELSNKIEFDSIIKNFDTINVPFTEAYILLSDDKKGVLRVKIISNDVMVEHFGNIDTRKDDYAGDVYSFTNKEWFAERTDESLVLAIKILIYLFYGEIDYRFIPAKSSTKLSSFSKFLNNSAENIYFANSLWKQRISTEGFKVSGHFRLQPIGEGRKERKLIWIEEFKKYGYNRKSTRENFNNE